MLYSMAQEKHFNKKILIIPGIILGTIMVYFMFFSGPYAIWNIPLAHKKIDQLKMENAKLERQNLEQELKNDMLKNKDPLEMEKKARERGMVKPGEKVYKYKVRKEN